MPASGAKAFEQGGDFKAALAKPAILLRRKTWTPRTRHGPGQARSAVSGRNCEPIAESRGAQSRLAREPAFPRDRDGVCHRFPRQDKRVRQLDAGAQ
jgi:hypothetical protein